MPLRLSIILAAPNRIIRLFGLIFHLLRAAVLSFAENISVSIGLGIACIGKFLSSELSLATSASQWLQGTKVMLPAALYISCFRPQPSNEISALSGLRNIQQLPHLL